MQRMKIHTWNQITDLDIWTFDDDDEETNSAVLVRLRVSSTEIHLRG